MGFDQNIKSLSADFVQYTQNTQGGQVSYSGSLSALAPYYAKWEYKIPLQKVVYLQEKTLISYEPLLSQAVYMQTDRLIDFLHIVRSAKMIEGNPNLYATRVEGREYLLHIKDSLPQKLEYEDELGNRIVIELQNVVLNPKLSQKEFEFTPPKGVDVIKQ